jgi:hypothetical protein
MKNLYLTNSGSNIWVDPETEAVGTLNDADRYDIRNIYYIDEPMRVLYKDSEVQEELEVKKGDILLTFYSRNGFTKRLGVVKSKQWKDNILGAIKFEQEQKEKWAAEKAKRENEAKCEDTSEPCCCGDCDISANFTKAC